MDSDKNAEHHNALDDLLDQDGQTPNDVDLLVQIGRRLVKLGQLDEAQTYYDRALRLAPDDGWTHIYLGSLHHIRRRHRSALRYFLRAAELLPDVACPFWCLCDIYDAMGKSSLAESSYKQAVSVESDDRQAKRKLYEWYERRYTPE